MSLSTSSLFAQSLRSYRPAPAPKPKRRKAPPKQAFTSTDGGRADAGIVERNDCAVRAAAIALGITYEDSHARFAALGRRPGKGTSSYMIAAVLGVDAVHEFRRQTFAQWSRTVPTGRYVVWVTGHVFAWIDGVQHDNGAGLYKPRARMVGYFRLDA